jgi:enediyne biosynthesis protein E4
MRISANNYLILFICTSLIGCKSKNFQQDATEVEGEKQTAIFTLLSPEKTHIDFQNIINEGLNTNVLMYEYFYNGGGVAVGDLNQDGFDDVYFTSNMQPNRLYLNKKNMEFQDITDAAGVAGREGPWKTGVTMVDINADGKLDIYVCHSGNLQPEKKTNELFINQGNGANGIPTFLEQAAQFGLDSPASSTNAYFFDADKDGDLDMFLLNHNIKSLPILDEARTAALTKVDDTVSGSRFYRNDKGFFKDITRQSGIQSSALSYGLGAGIADFNQDSYPDIYVSNDYAVPDRLYINNKNGTFKEVSQEQLGHTSNFSMGNDVADINNDLLPDIFTLDMLPEDNRRQKLLMSPDNYDKFDLGIKSGFHHQYMRNMLQLNNGNGSFSEIGQISGISNTDWSWAALFADYDNDGWKDLYITNGYLHDYTNLDFLKYMENFMANKQGGFQRQDVLELVQKMPSSNVKNYIFRNNGKLNFQNQTINWGMGEQSNSSGAAYSDLDNDGDLDLIVNNINAPVFVYQNEANTKLNNQFLKVKMAGENANKMGIGAKVYLFSQGNSQCQEQMPTRGFQSNVSFTLNFGLGKTNKIDSIKVIWNTDKSQVLKNIQSNQTLVLEEKNAVLQKPSSLNKTTIFTEITPVIASKQAKTLQNDFKRQSLMPNSQTFISPTMVKGDVNNDGLEDVFVGGSYGKSSELFIQQKGERFIKKPFPSNPKADVSDAVFFDANGDGFQDIYVAHGGYGNFAENDPNLQDQLFLNNGKGNFQLSTFALPAMLTSTGGVCVGDINNDSKPDLFVGGRVTVGKYPNIPRSYVLINDGKGNFKDNTQEELKYIGMVTDAAFIDLNKDRKQELIIIGEWMPITVFENTNGKLSNKTDNYFEKKSGGVPYSGWWNKLLVEDLNGDGSPDLLIGNLGLNSQAKASESQPTELYYKDFDDNGSIDPILCFYVQAGGVPHKSYPYLTRDELLEQMPSKRSKFTSYDSYSNATLSDIFGEDEIKDAKKLTANYFKTALFMNDGKGKFQEKSLPIEVQFSPIYTITPIDYDHDGKKDLILCGNLNKTRLKFGKYDANYGLLLKGDGKGGFSNIPQKQSGLHIQGDVRSVISLRNTLFFGINQQGIKAYK